MITNLKGSTIPSLKNCSSHTLSPVSSSTKLWERNVPLNRKAKILTPKISTNEAWRETKKNAVLSSAALKTPSTFSPCQTRKVSRVHSNDTILPFMRSASSTPAKMLPISKAKYELDRVRTHSTFSSMYVPPTPPPEPSPDLLSFLLHLQEKRALTPATEMERVLLQFLFPEQVLLLGMVSALESSSIARRLMGQRNYGELLAYYEKMRSTQSLSVSEQINEAICNSAQGRADIGLQALQGLAKKQPKHPLALYNLAVFQLQFKMVTETVNTLNTLIGLLITKNDAAILPYAIHVRAIANFEAKCFEYALEDFNFYVTLYKFMLRPDPSIIYCQFPYQLLEYIPSPENTPSAAVLPIRRSRKRESSSMLKTLFLQKPSSGLNSPKFSTKRNSTTAVLKQGIGRVEEIFKERKIKQIPEESLKRQKGALRRGEIHKTIVEYLPEEETQVRFINQRERNQFQYEKLKERIKHLRQNLDEKYFKEAADLSRKPIKINSKEFCLRDIETKAHSTFTLSQVEMIKKELIKDPEHRDYSFLDRMLQRLSFFSKLGNKDRLFLYSFSSFFEIAGGNPLYTEGDSGKEMYIIMRGSVGHKVRKLMLGNQEICISSAFDGECVGWQNAESQQPIRRSTTCIAYEDTYFLRIPLEGMQETIKRREKDEDD